jgi:hypothetical protein
MTNVEDEDGDDDDRFFVICHVLRGPINVALEKSISQGTPF